MYSLGNCPPGRGEATTLWPAVADVSMKLCDLVLDLVQYILCVLHLLLRRFCYCNRGGADSEKTVLQTDKLALSLQFRNTAHVSVGVVPMCGGVVCVRVCV